jgi:hypothetical protein
MYGREFGIEVVNGYISQVGIKEWYEDKHIP